MPRCDNPQGGQAQAASALKSDLQSLVGEQAGKINQRASRGCARNAVDRDPVGVVKRFRTVEHE
jgi:hypothetical protein